MRFKQNWSMIYQIAVGYGTIVFLLIPMLIYYVRLQEKTMAIVLVLCFAVTTGSFLLTTKTIPGFFSNEIEICEDGIIFINKGVQKEFFPWSDISEISKSKKYGTKTIVVSNARGEKIWFFCNKKIEAYLLQFYSDIERGL